MRDHQFGRLAYQTNGAGTLPASYTYDASGAPESVQVGADPATAARYYYVYDARGDVVNLTDATGVVVASYAYDTWGELTSVTENIPNANGWVNPYRYDGRDGVRSDATTGLDWMAVRAYDPTVGRFLSRDPLGRAPLYLSDNPYVYAGNNPLSNVDPSGQYRVAGQGSATTEKWKDTNQMMARVVSYQPPSGQQGVQASRYADQSLMHAGVTADQIALARAIAATAATFFAAQASTGTLGAIPLGWLRGSPVVTGILKTLDHYLGAPIAQTAYNAATVGAFTFDLASLFPWKVFQNQSTASDAFWLDPSGVEHDYSMIDFVTSLVGTLLMTASLVMIAAMPELGVIWAGLAIGVGAAMISILPRVKAYIDQEEQVLGYALS